ncbi:Pentatricopeptide repeat [Dillenia turbinata]|uniref:Pentatricopeptide repeat n=1 Tax=Dillenia turbinata TaxID=194707 RepID=A0AAN8Z1T5_9MAGN
MLRTSSWKKKPELSSTRISTCSVSLSDAKRLHQHLLVRGCLTDYSSTAQINSTYIASDLPSHALSVLERLPTLLLLSSGGASSSGMPCAALFLTMRSISTVGCAHSPDNLTTSLFPLFSKPAVAMYGRCGALAGAAQVFKEMLNRGVFDIVSWNSIVAAYVQCGEFRSGLDLFGKRKDSVGLCPDAISLVNLLPACAGVGAALQGKEVHWFALKAGLFEDLSVGNALVDMYAKCEMMDEANRVFKKMKVKDVVSWNAMVTGYSQVGRFEDALILFENLRDNNIELDVITWSAVITGNSQRGLFYCGSLRHGKETHCYAIKCILNFQARAIFDRIVQKDRNVVTWTVMIGGYAQYGEANNALELFYKMLQQDKPTTPNAFTISCAHLGTLWSGQQIHAHALHNRYGSVMLFVANCLIDMYSKSGDVDSTRFVFNSMHHRNEVSWTSMMTGYGMHGRGEEALQIFDGMMKTGRTGHLDEAMKLIKEMKEMPMEPSPAVHNLFSACVDDEEKGDLLEHSEKLALAYGVLNSSPGATIRITKNLRVCGDCHSAIIFISKIIDHKIILRDASSFHHFENGSCSCKGYW